MISHRGETPSSDTCTPTVPNAIPAGAVVARVQKRTHGARGPIIGRAAELGELRQALHDASEGHGSVFVLLGDAGIGKTRLAEALADEGAERGHDVLWGSSWEAGGASAFWPWTQLIRQLLDAVLRLDHCLLGSALRMLDLRGGEGKQRQIRR